MNIHLIDNLFTPEQIKHLNKVINDIKVPAYENGDRGPGICKELGRLQYGNILRSLTKDITDRIYSIISGITNIKLAIDHAVVVEYSNKYGKPNLPPHLDGDTNDLIINFQLDSNTSWDLGLNFETYRLKDNSAIIFNGNTEVHWRAHKDFKDREFVKMIFIRFYKLEDRSDYSHLNINQPDDIFKEFTEFRNSSKSEGI